MKRNVTILILILLLPGCLLAQKEVQLSQKMCNLRDVCLQLRSGVEQKSTTMVRKANDEFSNLVDADKIGTFSLKPDPNNPSKSDSHLIYTPEFFNKWLEEKDGVYKLYSKMDSLFCENTNRGGKVEIRQKNVVVKSKEVVRYKIYPPQKGGIEVLAVSEPFAKFDMWLHDLTHEQSWNNNPTRTEGCFCLEYALSYKGVASFEIEIENKMEKDISIVIFIK